MNTKRVTSEDVNDLFHRTRDITDCVSELFNLPKNTVFSFCEIILNALIHCSAMDYSGDDRFVKLDIPFIGTLFFEQLQRGTISLHHIEIDPDFSKKIQKIFDGEETDLMEKVKQKTIDTVKERYASLL